MTHLLTGEALVARAKELGVNIDSDHWVTVPNVGTVPTVANEATLQQRVLDAERHLREQRLWTLALVSSIVSILSTVAAVASALAAWWAVAK